MVICLEWGANDLRMVRHSSWCHCHPIISCLIKIQIGLTFLVPAYPGCPGKEAVKRVFVCLSMTTSVVQVDQSVAVCVCLDNNYWTKWPWHAGSSWPHLGQVRRSRAQVKVHGHRMQDVPFTAFTDARHEAACTFWIARGQHQTRTQHLQYTILYLGHIKANKAQQTLGYSELNTCDSSIGTPCVTYPRELTLSNTTMQSSVMAV